MPPLTFCTQFNTQQLLFEEFFNITRIFGIIHSYINIAVYQFLLLPVRAHM